MDNVEGLTTTGDGFGASLHDFEPEQTQPAKRKRGRPAGSSKKRGPGRPTKEEAAEKAKEEAATKEQLEQAEIAAFIYGLVSPLNPDARGEKREFHFTDEELTAFAKAAAPVWLKYMPTGPSKYSEELQLIAVFASAVGPKFGAYRQRRINEGNPIRWPVNLWRKLIARFKYGAKKETFTPASERRNVQKPGAYVGTTAQTEA